MNLLPALGGIDEDLLPAGAALVAREDVDLLLVLPGFEDHLLAAEVGELDAGAGADDLRGDVELVAFLGVLRAAPQGVAALHLRLHLPFHGEDLSGAVDDPQQLVAVAVIGQDGVAGFGLEQDLQARAVIRRMAVVLLVFEIVVPVGLMLDLVLAVMAEGIRAGALGFLGLLTGIALGQPDPGPDRILDDAALELGPDRGPFLGDQEHAGVVVAAVGETGRGPFGPVLPPAAEHGGDFQADPAEAFGVVVVAHEGPVLAVPAVAVALLGLTVAGFKHAPSPAFDWRPRPASRPGEPPNT